MWGLLERDSALSYADLSFVALYWLRKLALGSPESTPFSVAKLPVLRDSDGLPDPYGEAKVADAEAGP